MADGTVRWSKYVITNPDTGIGYWAGGGNGSVIGGGFDKYPRMFGGWDSVIYGVDDNGDMWWSQYTAGDGTGGGAWANNGVPARIGSGWKEIKRLWADPGGVIFGVRHAGELRRWRYLCTGGHPTGSQHRHLGLHYVSHRHRHGRAAGAGQLGRSRRDDRTDSVPGRLQPLRAAYLSNGGILRTGGNAFYERVSFSGDGNSLIFRVPATGARDMFGSQTPPRPEAEIVGANFDGRQPPFMTFAAYQADQASHPFFAGTGLSNGSTFGAAAYNGAASGWQVNTPLSPSFAQRAHGLNQGGGAVMAYATHPGAAGFSVSIRSHSTTLWPETRRRAPFSRTSPLTRSAEPPVTADKPGRS